MNWSSVARISLAAVSTLCVLVAGWLLVAAINQPVRGVVVDSAAADSAAKAVRETLTMEMGRGILFADVHAVARALAGLDWVRNAEVRRLWPDQLLVRVWPRIPVARWGEHHLVAADGVVMPRDSFVARSVEDHTRLPLLSGQSGDETLVMERFRLISRLLRPLGVELTALEVDASRRWQMQLDNGITVRFGAGDVGARVRRFLALYTTELHRVAANIESIDVRYADGVAVAWRDASIAERSGRGER